MTKIVLAEADTVTSRPAISGPMSFESLSEQRIARCEGCDPRSACFSRNGRNLRLRNSPIRV